MSACLRVPIFYNYWQNALAAVFACPIFSDFCGANEVGGAEIIIPGLYGQ